MQTESSRMQKFPEDSVIIREGEVRNEMYKIVSGKAAVYINYGEKNEYLLGILSEQQCFGELGIWCHQPSIYTVVAVYDVLVMRISINEFDSFLLNNNKNAVDIIRNLSWCVTNLKGNLDLVLEELSHGNEAEQQSARQIKEKIHRYTLEDLQKSGQFNEKI